MTAWSDLPNAAHIDRIIESLKTHLDIWTETRIAAWVARGAALDAAWSAARDAAWDAARHEAWNAAWSAAWYATWVATRVAAWEAARGAVAALIAWDDSDQFLELSSEKLEAWMRISDDPRAILLLPAVRVFERISELETV